jgi:hypothetical protein
VAKITTANQNTTGAPITTVVAMTAKKIVIDLDIDHAGDQ